MRICAQVVYANTAIILYLLYFHQDDHVFANREARHIVYTLNYVHNRQLHKANVDEASALWAHRAKTCFAILVAQLN